jgi:hypothetical protein
MPTQQKDSEPKEQSSAAVCAGPREQTVQTLNFLEHHRPALERDEVRHNIILSSLARLVVEHPADLRRWTLGAPGACAVQTPGYPIVLGELTSAQCRALADNTRDLDYPGVVGPDQTAQWFAERAVELGLTFLEPILQQIHVLRDKPNYPGAPGHARVIGPDDVELFADWTIAFLREAVPHDPPPSRERLAQAATEGRHRFWIVNGEPVSIAGIMPPRSPASIRRRCCADVAMRGRSPRRWSNASSRKAKPPPVSIRICAIQLRIAAMPKSDSSQHVAPGTIRDLAFRANKEEVPPQFSWCRKGRSDVSYWPSWAKLTFTSFHSQMDYSGHSKIRSHAPQQRS